MNEMTASPYTGTDLEVLTPQQTADLLHTTPAALANLRYNGGGVNFVKVGRKVLYRLSDVQDYLDANSFSRTDTRVPK